MERKRRNSKSGLTVAGTFQVPRGKYFEEHLKRIYNKSPMNKGKVNASNCGLQFQTLLDA